MNGQHYDAHYPMTNQNFNTDQPANTVVNGDYGQQRRVLGRPNNKRIIDFVDLAAVLLSLACLAISLCVVTPKLDWAWRLQFDKQIVVIGFLLNAMYLCLQKILPRVFLIFEHRFGKSAL